MQQPRKTYLLTGGTGYLGSLLSLQLLKKGNKIIFLGRSKNGEAFKSRIEKKLRNIGENVPFENIETLEIELSKKNLGLPEQILSRLKNTADAIWHLAADLSFKIEDKHRVFATNVGGLKNILYFIDQTNIPLYYTSTAYVHGLRSGLIFENDLIRPKKFNNHYEESKYEAEKIIHEWSKSPKNEFIIFRPSILIERKFKAAGFFGYYVVLSALNKLSRELMKNGRNLVFPFPYSKKTWVNLMPIDTAIKWIVEIADNPNSVGKTFNITNPHPFRMKEVVSQTFEIISLKVALFQTPLWFAELYFHLFYFVGKLLPHFKKIAEIFYCYNYYMTNSNLYDMSNTIAIIGEEKIRGLKFEHNFISTVAAEFLKRQTYR